MADETTRDRGASNQLTGSTPYNRLLLTRLVKFVGDRQTLTRQVLLYVVTPKPIARNSHLKGAFCHMNCSCKSGPWSAFSIWPRLLWHTWTRIAIKFQVQRNKCWNEPIRSFFSAFICDGPFLYASCRFDLTRYKEERPRRSSERTKEVKSTFGKVSVKVGWIPFVLEQPGEPCWDLIYSLSSRTLVPSTLICTCSMCVYVCPRLMVFVVWHCAFPHSNLNFILDSRIHSSGNGRVISQNSPVYFRTQISYPHDLIRNHQLKGVFVLRLELCAPPYVVPCWRRWIKAEIGQFLERSLTQHIALFCPINFSVLNKSRW